MSLHRGSVRSIKDDSDNGRLVSSLIEQFNYRFGYRPSLAEVRSWEKSLPVLLADLVDAGLEDVELLVEQKLPYSSARADVVVCGVHPKTGKESYVVLELKQWTRALPVDGTDDVVLGDRSSTGGLRLHPSAQAARYREFFVDFVAALSGEPDQIVAAAYLHNATEKDVGGLMIMDAVEKVPLFTRDRRAEFLQFLISRLAPRSGAESADLFTNSALRPSKQLMRLAAAEIRDRDQFLLLDEQLVAFQMVERAVERSRVSNRKQVVIVTGGPGSGKSVIALSLLGALSRKGRTVLHATGSSAFTQTLRRVAGHRAPGVKKMFTYYNQFMDAEKNGLDVLINDEAHRLKKTSTNRFTPASKRTGRPQVDELIDAARVPVFLLDEHQVVRPHEIGKVADIEAAAARAGCEVVVVRLDDQFRCGGSQYFEHWVLRFLDLEPGGQIPWTGDDAFELDVASGPSELERRLQCLASDGSTGRISAGYCWEWNHPRDDVLAVDVRIGDWHRPWNNPKDSRVGNAPGRPFWAIDPGGFDQVGCIYTAQGFEYDYSGVIIGPDLVWRQGAWVSRPEYSRDNQVRRADPEDFDRAIKNTYKVLLTRGMRGALIYSTDSQTQARIEELIDRR